MTTVGDIDPAAARDRAAFIALLRDLKERSGLTYRGLEQRARARGEVLARSTVSDVLGGKTAPRPDLLATFVTACGDGARTGLWLESWARVSRLPATAPPVTAEPPPASAPSGPSRPTGPSHRRPLVAAALALTLAGAAATAWVLSGGTDNELTAGDPTLPSGWVRLRPVSAPDLCLTDGRVADGRYTPLVAVQRPCDAVAPQDTLLEPLGRDVYRIQWHHPDYGPGCLKVLTEGPGAGLLEPMDDCRTDSRFHIEPSGEPAGGRYVLRVEGQGCVGIRDSAPDEGAEAVMGRCLASPGQVFAIESVP
ncbi:RICIN domain-containing protein [Streptomyces xiamenensis]